MKERKFRNKVDNIIKSERLFYPYYYFQKNILYLKLIIFIIYALDL